MDQKLPCEQVRRQCVAIIAAKLGIEPSHVRPEDRLTEDLGVDSMGMVDLLMEIEDHMPATLPADALQLQTMEDVRGLRVKDVVEILFRHQQ